MVELTGEDAFLKMALEQLIKGQDRLIETQAQVIERLDHLDDCIDGCKQNVKDLEKSTETRFNRLEETIRSIVPDGDFDGHRNYHVNRMRAWNNWEKIKGSVILKVVEYVAAGAAGWVILTLWGGFKISLTQ